MTNPPATIGPDGRPIAGGDSAPAAWPVLARLPWVGASAAAPSGPATAVSYGEIEPADRRGAPAASLRLAATPDRPQAAPTLQENVYTSSDAAAAFPPAAAARSGAPRRYRRIDPGDGRMASPPALRLAPPGDSNAFAARVYQWHAALAPYAGLAVTFVIALFAGLVYWSTLGQPSPASDLASPPNWSVDERPQPLNTNQWASPGRTYDIPETPFLNTPAIRLNTPSLGAAEISIEEMAASAPAETEAAAVEPIKPAAPIGEPAAPAASNDAEVAANVTPPGDAIAPTAAPTPPLVISYPTTPFAAFNFGPPGGAVVDQAANPALSR